MPNRSDAGDQWKKLILPKDALENCNGKTRLFRINFNKPGRSGFVCADYKSEVKVGIINEPYGNLNNNVRISASTSGEPI